MKIKLLIVKKHTQYNSYLYIIKEIFETHNFTVEITDPEPVEKLLDTIKIFKPNYLFCISLFDYLSKIAKITKIPVIHYELDKILNTDLFNKEFYSDYDFLFTTYKDDANKFKNIGLNNSFYLPFAYNILRHNCSETSFENNVSFVGSILKKTNSEYNMFIKHINKIKDNTPDKSSKYLCDSFLRIISELLQYQKKASIYNKFIIPKMVYNFDSNIQNLLSAFNADKEILINGISKEAANHHRTFFLQNIPDLSVYGNKDWKELKWSNITYKGFIKQFTDVSEVFYKSKININITRIYALDGLSDRIFNVLFSGGFLISNRNDALLELFDDKKEVVTFDSVEELKSLIKYYLKNETERNKIALSGYQKVIKEHSFTNRIEYIIKNIGE
jgi:spore maturation protein CgeB